MLIVTREERQWIDQLCCLIRVETDPARFAVLVKELNEFLLNEQSHLHLEVREIPICNTLH